MMNKSEAEFSTATKFTIILGLIFTALIIVTLSIVAGGWILNWMISSIKFEFACLIFGQGLLLITIPLGVLGNGFLRHLRDEKMLEGNDNDFDKEDEDDDEEAEWLAERIADLMIARMNQSPPKERRYTARGRSK